MKLVSAAVAVVVAGCRPGAVQKALDRVCDPGAATCTSLSTFQQHINAALDAGHMVGYITIVGGLPQTTTVGNARLAQDGAEPWDVNVAINQMSLTKVFTTIAVLQVIAQQNLTLDTKLSGFLPSDWTQGANIDKITIGDLLTHRAGFREGPSSDTSYAKLKQQIAEGVTDANRGVASYNNLNFAIFRVVLAAMDGQSITSDTDTQKWYIKYMQDHVFTPVGDTDPLCKPVGPHPGMWYPKNPAASIHGNDGGDWTALCGGGGWNLSAGDTYRVLLSLAGDQRLLTNDQKNTMNTKCLGWDCSVETQNDYVGKGGDWQDTQSGEVHTYMALFHKSEITVIVIVNSPPPSSLESIIQQAYAASSVPN